MKKIVKKYFLVILLILIIISGSLLFLYINNNNDNKKEFSNDSFSLTYDSNWNIYSSSDNKVYLSSDNAKLNIDLINISEEYKYYDLSNYIDNILYEINDQNKNYKLISSKEDKITKRELEGYKYLYENDNREVLIAVAKHGDKLVIFNYEAETKYFDILLDSVESIIYNFNIVNDKFDLSYKVSVERDKISYSSNNELVSLLGDNKEYEIASNNYYVKYSIPAIFKETKVDSKSGSYEYYLNNNRIAIYTNIFNSNIYDYIDKTDYEGSLYQSSKYYKDNQDKYTNYKEELDEFSIGDYKGYIYKYSYTNTLSSDKKIENYEIVLSLNKNHVLSIKVDSSDTSLSKELFSRIKIIETKNYSSYITKNIDNDMQVYELKKFSDYTHENYSTLTLKVPTKYRELDKNNNMYEERYFGLNYDSNNSTYQYEIKFKYSNLSSDNEISTINSLIKSYINNGPYRELSLEESREINGKTYSIYKGSYHKTDALYKSNDLKNNYNVNKKVLIYDINQKGCVIIIIDGNNIEVDDSIISDLTNFELNLN